MRAAENTPEAWLARTLRALAVLDAAELEQLSAQVEKFASRVPAEVALESARRAARLQQTLDGLLQATEESLRVLRATRGAAAGGVMWEH